MKLISINVFWVFVLSGIISACSEKNQNPVILPKDLKINQIQVLGTHNSYAEPIDSNVINLLDTIFTRMTNSLKYMPAEMQEQFKENHPNDVSWRESLNYHHPDFKTQLDSGLRSLEIDVYYDPTGNRFSQPAAYELLKHKGITDLLPFDSLGMKRPGFKVFHIADIDFRSHYTFLKDALLSLKEWSEAHPKHIPIFILLEAKDMKLPLLPNSGEVLPFTEKVYDELDAEIVNTLGRDKVIIPDDVRGDFATLEEAVLANNWPTVESSLGKFLFMLEPGSAGMADEDEYIRNHPSLKGRAMFVRSKTGRPQAAFLLMDNSIVRKKDIQQAVKKGYLVRTRADIETYEAKVNDYSRAQAAFESGAQVISTDFFKSGNSYGTSYVVKLPGGGDVRVNPVNYPDDKKY